MLFLWMRCCVEESYGNPNEYSVPPYIALGDPGLKGYASVEVMWIVLRPVLKRLFRDCLEIGNLFCMCHFQCHTVCANTSGSGDLT